MAIKRVNADLQVVGRILHNFVGTHYLDSANDIETALQLLDQAIHQLEIITQQPVIEDLSAQIDGQTDTFQTSEAFASIIKVVLNGLEQTEGAEADYIILDSQHIQFYRSLKTGEILTVEYWSA